MSRIAVGGFQHETNTFAPTRAALAAFERGGAWPPFSRGEAMLAAVADANIPVTGALAALRDAGASVVPLAWAAASPSAHVTDEAFEAIAGAIVDGLREAIARDGPVDGVCLDLHGAMVTASHDDGEGELLQRVRDAVGPRVPVVASLDWHANVSDAMLAAADGLVGYRSYPHVDMAETGARAARLLLALAANARAGGPPVPRVLRRLDYLVPLPAQCSTIEPARSLLARLGEIEQAHGVTLTLAPGFPMADVPECGMTVIAIGAQAIVPPGPALASAEATTAAADALAALVRDAEPSFAMTLHAPVDAVAHAMRIGRPGAPVVLADTQDNPGAGGNGDTTGLLAALVAARARDAVFGLLIDGEAAALAHEAGIGAVLELALGERSGLPGHVPLAGRFAVEALHDGRFECTGPMFRGFRMQLGPMARLRPLEAPGVAVLVATHKSQTADQDMMRVLGIEPAAQAIVALKSSVHFRADFEPIAAEVLVVRTPGPALADPADFAWTRLRDGLRLHPLGPAFRATGARL